MLEQQNVPWMVVVVVAFFSQVFLENVRPFISCLFFFSLFLEVESSLRLLIPFFRLGSAHSGSACLDDCGCVFPDESSVSSLPDRFPHYAWTVAQSAHCNCLVKGVCTFRCNLPSALFAEWPGPFMCHCSNAGLEQMLNKSQHTKLTLEKKIIPPLLPGVELATFRSWVWHSYQQAIPAPKQHCYVE